MCNDKEIQINISYSISNDMWCSTLLYINKDKISQKFFSLEHASKKLAKGDVITQFVEYTIRNPLKQDITKQLKGLASGILTSSKITANIAKKASDLDPTGLTSKIAKTATAGLDYMSSNMMDAPWKSPDVGSSILAVNIDAMPSAAGPRQVVVMDAGFDYHESPLEGISYQTKPGMDMLYRSGYIDTVKVPTNTTHGILFHLATSPIAFHNTFAPDSPTGSDYVYPTPAGYITSMYRGGGR